MGSRGRWLNPSSQSLRASPGRPELKAVVARRTTSSTLCLLISGTLKQNDAAARQARSWAARREKAENESRPLFFRHCERSEAIHRAARKSGLLRRYAPRNDGEGR